MLRGLKNKSILKATEQHLKKRQLYTQPVRLKRLAVLIDARFDIDILSVVSVANKLGIQPKYMTILGLKQSKVQEEGSKELTTSYFDASQLGFSGVMKTQTLQKFINEPFDVLVNFYMEDIPELNLVAAASKAKFKAGHVNVNNQINDLVIGTTSGKKDLFVTELKKYLKILNII